MQIRPSARSKVKSKKSNWYGIHLNSWKTIDGDHEEKLSSFESSYDETKAKLREKLESFTGPNLPVNMDAFMKQQSSFLEEITAIQTLGKNSAEIRLPRLNIPRFAGNHAEWFSFRDLFTTSVHNKLHISKAQKFQYLKGLLEGQAASLIRHILVTEDNYDEAWNLLTERYDHKKQIIFSFIKQFLELKSVSQLTVDSIRKLTDNVDEINHGLKALGDYANSKDPWLTYLLLSKFDIETKNLWSLETTEQEEPSYDLLIKFLKKRCMALEGSTLTETSTMSSKRSNKIQGYLVNKSSACVKCGNNHVLSQCPEFRALSTNERYKLSMEHKLCLNCLHFGHQYYKCRSTYSCQNCRKRHHTLLHRFDTNAATTSSDTARPTTITASPTNIINDSEGEPSIKLQLCAIDTSELLKKFEEFPFQSTEDKTVDNPSTAIELKNTTSIDSVKILSSSNCHATTTLLPTCVVKVRDFSGQFQQCRVLLDTGAQASFISENCSQRLKLPRRQAKFLVSGVGSIGAGYTKGIINLELSSIYDAYISIQLQVYVMHQLTSKIPSTHLDVNNWYYIKELELADPNFSIPSGIDLIIGSDKFFEVIQSKSIMGPQGYPTAHETIFGWVIGGPTPSYIGSVKSYSCTIATEMEMNSILRKFWELEDVPNKCIATSEEVLCEQHFIDHTKRDENGRYIVRLPFRNKLPNVENSYKAAISRQFAMERKFRRDPSLETAYKEFMKTYEDLGHMQSIDGHSTDELHSFFLPHHAVLKESSTTSKLRVVFDGSSKSSNGNSINDELMVGGVIQPSLLAILLKFRIPKIAIVSDIEKMYRQILVHPDDRNYQRILWRFNENDKMQEYNLSTVTYGLSCSPFLATRTLQQIASDYEVTYPNAAQVIRNNFYMDDLLCGADNLQEAY